MNVQGWGATDAGLVRENNEDVFCANDELRLYLVADGMGGHAAGEVASALCRDHLVKVVQGNQERLDALHETGELARVQREEILRFLESAVAGACQAVFATANADSRFHGMGCTLTCLLVVANRGFIAHVGDSRLYLCRSNQINVLTNDHRVLEELIRQGRISREQAEEMNLPDGLSRAMGVQPSVQADVLDLEVAAGDRFLLCSDGLHGEVEAVELRRSLNEVAVEDLTDHFISRTLELGAPDNVTVVVVAANANEETALATPVVQVSSKMEAINSVPLFDGLSYKERVALLAVADERTYAPGEMMMREGEPGDEFFIIVGGLCAVQKGFSEIAQVGAGVPIGELALVRSAPRSASVVAVADVTALAMHRDAFFQYLQRNPGASTKILWRFIEVLGDRLANTSTDLEFLRSSLKETAIEMPRFRIPE